MLFISAQWKLQHRALACGSRQTTKAFLFPPQVTATLTVNTQRCIKHACSRRCYTNQAPVPVMTANVALKGSHLRLPFLLSQLKRGTFPTGSCSPIFSAKRLHDPNRGSPVLFFSHQSVPARSPPRPRPPLSCSAFFNLVILWPDLLKRLFSLPG